MKITLPDPLMAQLQALAANTGEPVSRVATRMVSDGLAELHAAPGNHANTSTSMVLDDDADFGRHAPWIEPIMGDPEWKARMWGSIVALHGRYPRALEHLKNGWWTEATHVETLCALVVWRDWIDQEADDPRYELAFQAQLADYGRVLHQEGGGVERKWTPGVPPADWIPHETPA